MFSIVHTTWINDLKQRKRRRRLQEEWNDAMLDTVADPAPTPETNAWTGQIIEAVERLPESQRSVLLLVGLEGLPYHEAAEVLGIPIGTVMSRLFRARKAIHALFQHLERREGRSVAVTTARSRTKILRATDLA